MVFVTGNGRLPIAQQSLPGFDFFARIFLHYATRAYCPLPAGLACDMPCGNTPVK